MNSLIAASRVVCRQIAKVLVSSFAAWEASAGPGPTCESGVVCPPSKAYLWTGSPIVGGPSFTLCTLLVSQALVCGWVEVAATGLSTSGE